MESFLRACLSRFSLFSLGMLGLSLCLQSPGAYSEPLARDVRVGVYENAPKIMLGEDGQLSGILGELLHSIAREEGWVLHPVVCTWDLCLEQVAAGQIDLLPDVAFSEARAQTLDFHRVPSLHSWSQLYKRENLVLDSVLDLQGMRILVLAGSIQQHYLQTLLESFSVQATLIPVQSLRAGFEQVSTGEAEAIAANYHFGDFVAAQYGVQHTSVMFQPARLFYATGKGNNPVLLSTIDRYLEQWTRDPDSGYFQILQRWGTAAPMSRVSAPVRWGLATLGTLLLLALGGTALLRRQVALKTRHLRTSEQKLTTILNSVESYIYIKDTDLRYQYGNGRVCDYFGRSPEQLVGCRDEALLPPDIVTAVRRTDQRVLARGERVMEEETLPAPDGEGCRTYLTVKIPLRDSGGKIYALCGISTDITEQKRNIQEIHQLAFYDQLTGLANRRLLLDRLAHALATRERSHREGALLFIDLDNFKDLNDTLGHDMGDQLLRQVAERLDSHVRETDTLARLGGDEFVLMFEGLDPQVEKALYQVESVAGKLLEVLREPYALPGRIHNCTVSIGVAMFSDAQSTV